MARILAVQVVLKEYLWVTADQLDILSRTPLVVAGWGRLQLGVTHWAISVTLLQVVVN